MKITLKENIQLLKDESLFILNTDSEEDIDEMNSFLGRAFLIISGIEEGAPQGISSGEYWKIILLEIYLKE